MTNGSLMNVKSIAECTPRSILHALSDNWSWKPIFGHFESGRVTQVLLYIAYTKIFLNQLFCQFQKAITKKIDYNVRVQRFCCEPRLTVKPLIRLDKCSG